MYRYLLLSMATQLSVAAFSPYFQIALRNKGYSHSLVGIIIALGQLASCVIPMVVSSVCDRAGKTKPFILLATSLSLLTLIPMLSNVPLALVIFLSIVLNGFFWCLNPLVDGFLSRGLKGEASAYGSIRAAGSMSYVLALLAFGLLGWPVESDNSSIRLCASLFLVLHLAATLFAPEKRETKKDGKRQFFSFSWFPRSFYVYMAIGAMSRFSEIIVERFLPAYMTEELGLGNYFSVFIALGAFCEVFCLIYGGRILKNGKATPYQFLLLASLAMAVRLSMYLIPGIVPFTLAQCLHGITFGFFHIGSAAFVAREVDPDHYDVAMTIYWAVATSLPKTFSALLGGYLIQYFGYPTLFISYAIIPLLAVFIAIACRKDLQGKETA